MTYELRLTSNDGTISVDMTNMNPIFTFDYNNPIIKIPTPKDENHILDGEDQWNVITLNLNMSMQTVLIEFTETSGLTNLGSAMNTISPTTVFEKLMWLTSEGNSKKKKLYVNGTEWYVEIEGWRTTLEPGRKDLVKHSLTLPVVSKEGSV